MTSGKKILFKTQRTDGFWGAEGQRWSQVCIYWCLCLMFGVVCCCLVLLCPETLWSPEIRITATRLARKWACQKLTDFSCLNYTACTRQAGMRGPWVAEALWPCSFLVESGAVCSCWELWHRWRPGNSVTACHCWWARKLWAAIFSIPETSLCCCLVLQLGASRMPPDTRV